MDLTTLRSASVYNNADEIKCLGPTINDGNRLLSGFRFLDFYLKIYIYTSLQKLSFIPVQAEMSSANYFPVGKSQLLLLQFSYY